MTRNAGAFSQSPHEMKGFIKLAVMAVNNRLGLELGITKVNAADKVPYTQAKIGVYDATGNVDFGNKAVNKLLAELFEQNKTSNLKFESGVLSYTAKNEPKQPVAEKPAPIQVKNPA